MLMTKASLYIKKGITAEYFSYFGRIRMNSAGGRILRLFYYTASALKCSTVVFNQSCFILFTKEFIDEAHEFLCCL